MFTNPFAARPAVLVADNDIVLRSVLRALLARLDLEVRLASDSVTALAEARRGSAVGLIMLDLDMPGGGLTVCRTLRNDPVFAQVPIVILTGFTDAAARGDSLAAGEDISIMPTADLPAGFGIVGARVTAANTVKVWFASTALIALGTSIALRVTALR